MITIPGEFNSTDRDGIQQITFADGTTMTRDLIQAAAWYRAGAGDVTVTAQDGSATLVAGTGNDTLVAGDADNNGAHNTFVYGVADSNLDIEAHVYSYNSFSNTLDLSNLNRSDITFSRAGADVLLTVKATGKIIKVGREFNSADRDGVQQIVFADGTFLERAQLNSLAYVRDSEELDDQSSIIYDLGWVTTIE